MTPEQRLAASEGIVKVVAQRVVASLRLRGFAVDFEDAAQGARLGVWKAAQAYDASRGTPFHLWAWAWAKRYAYTEAYRSAGLTNRGDGLRPSDSLDDLAPWEEPGYTEPDAADAVAVRHAVSQLPDREREVVFLTYWRDLGPTAIGETVGLSKSGTRKTLERALATLRHDLGDAA